jgi:hypothetical protein
MTDTATKLTTLTIPLETAVRGIGAVLPHVATDDFYKAIDHILVTPETFSATNRNTIGRFQHRADIDPGVASLLLPDNAAAWLTKTTARSLNVSPAVFKTLEVTFINGAVRVHHAGLPDVLVWEFPYPPVDPKLSYPSLDTPFDTWKPATDAAPILFDPELVVLFGKSAKKLNRRTGPAERMRFELGTREYGNASTAPMKVTIGDDFVGLIQPIRYS